MKLTNFGDMPQGTHFQEANGRRKFIKLQHTLPSGLPQIHQTIRGKDYITSHNAIDYDGTPAKCPDWCPFEVIDKP
jgi:hypothetical protein